MKNNGYVFVISGLLALFFAAANSLHAIDTGAKPSTSVTYSATASAISTGPTTLYGIVLSTGAAGDYTAIFDSGSATGITANTTSAGFKSRIFSSTTVNTSVFFDPPLAFKNGLVAAHSSGVDQGLFIYEKGITNK